MIGFVISFCGNLCISASCGSCYSFATMGMLEARVRILTNNTDTPILSPQQVVSCSEYSQGKLLLWQILFYWILSVVGTWYYRYEYLKKKLYSQNIHVLKDIHDKKWCFCMKENTNQEGFKWFSVFLSFQLFINALNYTIPTQINTKNIFSLAKKYFA